MANDFVFVFSLEETKAKVDAALADDFDTPKAINAIEELVHKANVELSRKLPTGVSRVATYQNIVTIVISYDWFFISLRRHG